MKHLDGIRKYFRCVIWEARITDRNDSADGLRVMMKLSIKNRIRSKRNRRRNPTVMIVRGDFSFLLSTLLSRLRTFIGLVQYDSYLSNTLFHQQAHPSCLCRKNFDVDEPLGSAQGQNWLPIPIKHNPSSSYYSSSLCPIVPFLILHPPNSAFIFFFAQHSLTLEWDMRYVSD